MRNVIAVMSLLLTALPLSAQELEGIEATDCCNWREGVWGSVDALVWTPRMRGLDFAITEDGSAFAIGAGQVHEVDLVSDAGVRANLGYAWSNGWDIGFGYTHFETGGTTTVNRPGGTGQLFPTFSHPGGPAEADSAIGTAYLDYDVFDLVARRNILNSQCAAFDLYGGLRWANIGQGVGVELDGRDFTQGEVSSATDVNGLGIRFGGTGRWRLAPGFSIFGNAAAAAIRADFSNRRVETDFDGARLLVDVEDSYTQATFNFDTSLGIAWEHNNWLVGAGYEVNVWTNISESLRFVDDIEQGGLASTSGDLLLDGFFFRVAKSW